MREQHDETQRATSLTIDELARVQDAKPLRDVGELAADIWQSDDELEAFLADLRSSRDQSCSHTSR